MSVDASQIKVGDRILFEPSKAQARWTVRAMSERYIVATATISGQLSYTVVDLTGWQNKHYNGAGNGVVRSSLNTLGGGWDIDKSNPTPACEKILEGLETGQWELSHRRVMSVRSIGVIGAV